MDTTNKFSKFVAKLEQKMLDSNQESMVFFNLSGKEIGGLALENSINDGNCVNGNNQCDGSINNKCSNNQCDNALNSRKCTAF
ncbi:hypothetical protein [Chryseobacterium sp. RR2-3-20]|uniref:hypothetical protein n=1 Tax=Chryseobacterium sp. RR2-3-20 TaxID=2787626 RepID=UPI001ADF6466|nr:hypothetical protein [Chryseobacterium sp. RR2-3-20]